MARKKWDKMNAKKERWFREERRSGHPVYVNVYNGLHMGLEVHGKEYSYGQGGVYRQEPKQHKQDFWYSVLAGFTRCDDAEVNRKRMILQNGRFGPDGYRLFSNNCRNFTFALCRMLVVEGSRPNGDLEEPHRYGYAVIEQSRHEII